MITLGTIALTHPFSVIETRKKLQLLAENLTGDPFVATRVATGVSAVARAVVREGVSPSVEVALEATRDQRVLWITFVDSAPVSETAVGYFDEVVVAQRSEGRHERSVAVRLTHANTLGAQTLERSREILQHKGRDELMAEVQAKNAELQESLENLRRTTSAKERMESELNIGQEIQMSMLPLVFPPFPDRHEFTIFAELIPAREVGGDLYDFFFIDDDHLCVCIGDVSGKGVPAALFMAVTKTLIKSTAKNDSSPASILTQVNDELSENNESCMFVTVFAGILNVKSGEFVYTNAGHNPPYIRRAAGNAERLDKRHGPILGVMSGTAYGQDTLLCAPGDMLLFYTDGVTEAMDSDSNLFSDARLEELVATQLCPPVEDTVQKVVSAVKEFEAGATQSDDITVMSLEFRGLKDTMRPRSFAITITDDLSEIERVNEAFDSFADQNEVPTEIRLKFSLVFDELLNNIISYGFPDEDSEHEIEVKCELSGRRLVITITDDGIPFNPFTSKPPDTSESVEDRKIGGLGIHLVRNLMDECSYERLINRNVVVIVKTI